MISLKLTRKSAVALAVTFVAGITLGLAVGYYFSCSQTGRHSHLHSHSGRYRFTNPLLDCDIAAETLNDTHLRPFKRKLKEIIDGRIAAGDTTHVSVFVRHLDSGSSFGINSKELFAPASLLKVPLMMAWLKRAERNPAVLRQKFTYAGNRDLTATQAVKPRETLRPGVSYTVDDLLYRMLAYSDNNAWWLLLTNIDTKELDAIVADLDVSFDPAKAAGDSISVRSFSSFFRVLYNATYLNREMSEKALEYLSHMDFRDGIVAGVPIGVPVASKFGERTLENSGVRELHEFGIVYHPKGPYLIGIMTKGHDFARLTSVLRDISVEVYGEMGRQRSM